MTYISTKTKDSHLETRTTQTHQSRARHEQLLFSHSPSATPQECRKAWPSWAALTFLCKKRVHQEMAHTPTHDTSFFFLPSVIFLGQADLSARNRWQSPGVQWVSCTPKDHQHFCEDNNQGVWSLQRCDAELCKADPAEETWAGGSCSAAQAAARALRMQQAAVQTAD